MTGIGYLAALLGGLLALLSPCSALLLPAFFAYSIDSASRLLARTGIFYAGLASTLVPLGAAGSYAGRFFHGNRDALVLMRRLADHRARARPDPRPGIRLEARLGAVGQDPADDRPVGVRPRRGLRPGRLLQPSPILGSVLTVAAVSGSPVYGGLLLAVYALGMAVPLFVLALLWERFDLGRRRWLRGRALRAGRFELHTTSLLSGLFFIALGVMFLAFDGASALPGLLDVDDSFAVEQRVRSLAAAVPDGVLLGLVAAGAVAFGLVQWRRKARAVTEGE